MIEVPILINCLSECIYETLVCIHKEHSEWLLPKFRNYPWLDKNFQIQFTQKFNQKFCHISDRDQLISKIINLLPNFFVPSFFVSYQFTELLANIRKYTHPALELEARTRESSIGYNNLLNRVKTLDNPFAILLIDAENITLDVNLENIIPTICNYPIQIKIAVANWRSLGKKDLEFYNKGYEMIHVPQGKNSADLKMITVGTSIWGHYPMAKEFIICSSDGDLNHLCIALQNNGLTVYRISRKAEQIMVFNSQTGKTKTYTVIPSTPTFSKEELVKKIKQLISEEQTKNQTNWLLLEEVTELFKQKYRVSIEEILANHYPGKTSLEAFHELKQNLVLHQVTDKSEIYITTFDVKTLPEPPISDSYSLVSPFKDVKELEKSLLTILQSVTSHLNQDYVMVSHVASEFQKSYKLPLTRTLKLLQIPGNFVKFLESSHKFKVKKENNTHYVGLNP